MSDLNIDAKAISDSLKSTLGDWKDSVKDDVVGYVSACKSKRFRKCYGI